MKSWKDLVSPWPSMPKKTRKGLSEFFQERSFDLWGKRLNQEKTYTFAVWFLKAVKDTKRNKAFFFSKKQDYLDSLISDSCFEDSNGFDPIPEPLPVLEHAPVLIQSLSPF